MKYSQKMLKECNTIKRDDIFFDREANEFKVSYKIRFIQKTKRWSCSCFNNQFALSQNKYCKHILAMLRTHDIKSYNKEIEEC